MSSGGHLPSHVRVGQHVSAGDDLGRMVDLLAEPLAAITAPVSGIVLVVVTSPAIKADGLLLAIGRVS